VHPGSYKGQALEQGVAAFGLGLRDAMEGLPLRDDYRNPTRTEKEKVPTVPTTGS
jgi:hypothetical protein